MKRLFGVVVVLAVVLGEGTARADFLYTTLDAPGAGLTQAFGINNSGQIVGEVNGSPNGTQGFLLSGGS